jgi:hypothetical protein
MSDSEPIVDFTGFMFRARKTIWQGHIPAHGFMPAASPKALTSIGRTIRRWALHHHSDKSPQHLAETYNQYIQGWINQYGNFYRTLTPSSTPSQQLTLCLRRRGPVFPRPKVRYCSTLYMGRIQL